MKHNQAIGPSKRGIRPPGRREAALASKDCPRGTASTIVTSPAELREQSPRKQAVRGLRACPSAVRRSGAVRAAYSQVKTDPTLPPNRATPDEENTMPH